jgi:hypothetical protein
LFGGSGPLGIDKRLRSAVGCDDRDQVCELLRLQCEQLVAGLSGLKRAGRALALPDQSRHLGAVGIDVADDTGLHAECVLKAADRVLPARASIGDEPLNASVRPVTMMMITAMILATGPSIDWRMDCSGASQGIEEPDAWAAGARRKLRVSAVAVVARR